MRPTCQSAYPAGMPSSSTLVTFLAATAVIILFPGPAMLFLVATG